MGAVTETTAGTGTVSATTINNLGQLYKSTAAGQIPIVLTRGATNGTWTVAAAADGGYDNISVTGATVGGTDYVYVDLDGAGGADITFTLANVWALADTINIASITQTAVDPANNPITFAALPTGATIGASNVVTWDLAGSTALPITDYASTSVINSLSNDGYASGLLKSLSIRDDGTIGGFFTNGQTSDVAQIRLASFGDTSGLQRMGSNLFGETILSGPATINAPGAAGMGTIASNSLEMSNTDIATEFINMITAQKSYSANARIITTEDQMLTELINIKR
jgi:flagellar hook protein FlgE